MSIAGPIVRTTRTQRLRTKHNLQRALAFSSGTGTTPNDLVIFLCHYGDVSHVVLCFLSVSEVGRLETTSKRFHNTENTTSLPLRTDIVWRQLWINACFRTSINKDKAWLKSSWGRRSQPKNSNDPTHLPLVLDNVSSSSTTPQRLPLTTTPNTNTKAKRLINWRNTYRAASLFWSRRRSGKTFKKLVQLQRSGALPQSLQRTVSNCHLTSFEFLVNGMPLRVLRSTKSRAREWSSKANRIGSTLSADGARFFSSSIAVKIDWSPITQVTELNQLETIELWTTSTVLKRRRNLLSMRLSGGSGNGGYGGGGGGGGSGGDNGNGNGKRRNSSWSSSSSSSSSSHICWKNFCVLEEGDFRLYQVPEKVLVGGGGAVPADVTPGGQTKCSSLVDVSSSIVIGTWGGGRGEETIAFCMVHVHMQHAVERLLSPLPRGMALTIRPPPDDLHAQTGTRGYTIVLSLRSFARCCWEKQATQFDLIGGEGRRHATTSTMMRGCLLENGQLSWDTSLHFGLEPSLVCRTPCFSTTVSNACIVEVTMYDEYQNVVLGSIDVVQIQPLEQFLQRESDRERLKASGGSGSPGAFWEQIRQGSCFGATIDLESRCGIEIKNNQVGIIQIALCRVLADQSGEAVLAVERLEVGIRDQWRQEWFG